MATVQNYIHELLFEQDCVVIPEFGGFIANFKSSSIEKSLHYITPSTKWFAFNGLLKSDDGLLVNYIAKIEHISREEAVQKVKIFVDDLKKDLKMKPRVHFEHLGFFSLNEEQKVVFTPDTKQNFFTDSFGLDSLNIYPLVNEQELSIVVSQNNRPLSIVDRETQAEVLSGGVIQKRRKKVLPTVAGIGTALLLGFAMFFYEHTHSSLSTLNPFANLEKQSTTVSASATPTAKKEESQPTNIDTASVVIQPEETQDSHTKENQYYVIVGSFGSKKNANKLLKALKQQGFTEASIIEPNTSNKLIKVSATGCPYESQAYSKASEIKTKLKSSAWIYKSFN